MTRDDIMKLAREAGMARLLDEHAHEYGNGRFEYTDYPELETFAALVAATEREAIIKATIDQGFVGQAYADDFAAVIRNRGKE